MDRKIPLIILAIALIATALAILSPGGRQVDSDPKLPWQIEILPDGATKVFDLTLGTSTLKHAEQRLSASPVLSLFRSPDGVFAIEAYFQRATLSGLRADFIFTLAIDQPTAALMFDRGLRISQLGSGGKKVTLSQSDTVQAMNSTIRHLTYIPATDLDRDILQRHFGKPERIIGDAAATQHWLYPGKGLDIAVNPEAKEVFQYVHPQQFQQLVEPLLAARPDD